MESIGGVIVIFIIIITFLQLADTAEYKVTCSPKVMVASITLPSPQSTVYLDRLKGYPVCAPKVRDGKAVFELSLEDIYSCGTTRVYDRITGRRLYYHMVVIELGKSKSETVLVKCDFEGDKQQPSSSTRITDLFPRTRRNVLPDNFTEAVEIEKIGTVTVEVPAPMVHVSVKQNGLSVDTQVNVQPGTPLQMDIALDRNSSDTYGLFVKDVKVTDNSPNQEETIIQNGCSLDPYLFTNFDTADGNNLTAKFRAFKFPDSSYVLFIGTINVCLQTCKGVPCNNGQVGYGRRRRDLDDDTAVRHPLGRDPNKIFEVTMTTIMRVGFGEEFVKNKGREVDQSIAEASRRQYDNLEGEQYGSDNAVLIGGRSASSDIGGGRAGLTAIESAAPCGMRISVAAVLVAIFARSVPINVL